MSSSIVFYLRDTDGVPHCLNDYSRSSHIYRALESTVGYAKYVPLNMEKISSAISSLRDSRSDYMKSIEYLDERSKQMWGANNDLHDKMEVQTEIDAERQDLVDEIEMIDSAIHSLYFLYDMAQMAHYSEAMPEEYVWAGIDASWSEEEDE